MLTEFGILLKTYFVKKNRSIDCLADQMGIHERSILAVMNGYEDISHDILQELGKALGLTKNESDELNTAALLSGRSIDIPLDGLSDDDKGLIAKFIIKFNTLTIGQKAMIHEVLDRYGEAVL